jgi:surfeit locus 1 family protein
MNASARPRSAAARIGLLAAAVLAFCGFIALGTWQLERRAWKLDLIARVTQRVHAAAVDAPARPDWPRVAAATDEYRRVRVNGTYLHDRETLVAASTELGAGYWVLTPLRCTDGSIVLVNRGFVPPEQRDRAVRSAAAPSGAVAVTGLLRISEPGGTLLRHNDPAADRWYSRDTAAIARTRGLDGVAPYFIDAEAPVPGDPAAVPGAPVAGLTVIAFRNSHLEYALTWYALAILVVVGMAALLRAERAERGDSAVAAK